MLQDQMDFPCFYLVAASSFTCDAGVTAGHNFNIFSYDHHTGGTVISREAALKREGGKRGEMLKLKASR